MRSPAFARRAQARISAGLVDAGLASLATFACGLFAGRNLGPEELGAYAVVFSGFVVAAIIPAQLLFTPSEIEAIRQSRGSRLFLLRDSLRLGIPISLVSAVSLVGCTWLVRRSIPPDTVTALTVTAIASAFVSPIQDHLRRMFHLDGSSWLAATVSGVHFALVVGTLLASRWTGLAPAWVPFGSLTLGNTVSLALGLLPALKVKERGASRPASLHLRTLLPSGFWLLLVGLLPTGAAFVSTTMVLHLAGAASVGYAEAARLIAQPLFVFSVGLAAVLGPQSTEAAQRLAPSEAQGVSFEFRAWLLTVGIAYGALVSTSSLWNPFTTLLPNAYVIGWLVTVSLVANVLNGFAFPQRSELLGAGRTRTLVAVEGVGSLARVAIAATAKVTGPFAIPAGLALLGICRWHWYGRTLQNHYSRAVSSGAAAQIQRAISQTARRTDVTDLASAEARSKLPSEGQ